MAAETVTRPVRLRVLDLFAGIGGFSLGLERTGGFKTVAFCEIEPFPRRVLAKHWPEVPCYDDVRTLTAERLRADGIRVDVVCGGFPCQPFSTASRGRRVAISLWPELHRIVRDLRPAFVAVENVQEEAITVAALDLDRDGYTTHVRRIGAADAGADHTRNRWWACAHTDAQGELRRAFDAEVALLPEVCRGLWGAANYSRAIRVPDGLPDRFHGGGLDEETGGYQEGRSACSASGGGSLPNVRQRRSFAAAPSRLLCSDHSDDPLPGMPRFRRSKRRFPKGEAAEGVQDLRQAVHAEPQQEAHDVQPRMSRVSRARQRDEAVASKNEWARIGALGNAVLPVIPELIGRAILASLPPSTAQAGGGR